jgi:hypothetical protein
MQISKTINHQFGKVVVIPQMGWDGVNCVCGQLMLIKPATWQRINLYVDQNLTNIKFQRQQSLDH